MAELAATDFATTTVIANIALAGAAVLGVSLVSFGWRKIIGFFGR
ncbi:hypothetical protein [Arcobacter venerupis]|nr:hypothetical protein [Arcobacter venerupis]